MPSDQAGVAVARARRRGLRRWFRDLRVSRKLAIVIAVHLLHATVLLVVTAYGMQALSASRAYVEGEGLWSKAEKEAVLQIQAYAATGDPARLRAFHSELNVTLGDRMARLELDKPHPDDAVVRAGFIQGRLSPDDVPNLKWLYRTFGAEPHIAAAVHIWRVADENITVLLAHADALQEAVVAGDRARVTAASELVYADDRRLTVLEDEFSRTLGDGARWLTVVATAGAIGLTVLFVGGALAISAAVARQISRPLKRLEAAAHSLSGGALGTRVRLEGRDEVSAVGQVFDGMAERLEGARRESDAAAAALRDSLEQFRVLAEGSPIGIFHTDARGVVDYANPKWTEITGHAFTDHAGVRGAIHPQDYERLATQWRACLAAGTELQTEVRYVHADGKVLECATRASPVRDPAGRVTGFVGLLEDATGRKQAERQRLEIGRLQELNAFRTQFINTAAHELRTPLTPLRAQLHVLKAKRSQHYEPDEQRSLQILDRNVARMAVLVEDLLQSARIQAGRLGLEVAPTDVHSLVREAVESFQPAARERGVQLTATMGGDATVPCDAKRVSQVLYNLLSNALKFTSSGGHIHVAAAGGPDGVEVRVRDDGLGIAPDGLRRLFAPFIQVHDTLEVSQPGSGLGLYICKAIVEMHGGSIGIESAGIGKGSTVAFRLPRKHAPQPDVAPAP